MNAAKGQKVWAKLKYSSFWPAEIVDTPVEIPKPPPNRICVLFYGTNNYGFVEPENVKDYAQNREAYVNKGKGFQFKKAVTDMDAQLNATQASAPTKKRDAFFVKIENESNNIEIVKYNCPSVAGTLANAPNDTISRLLSELSDIRKKHNDAIYQLEKNKEKVITLNNEKQQHKSRKYEAEKKINVLCHESVAWKDEKKQLESSIASLREEKLAAIEQNDRLRKELKASTARLKQNLSGAQLNKRYHSQTPALPEPVNSYEVKQLLAHRKRNAQRELKVQWKDTWEKESNLNCPKLLSAYWRKHKY